MKARLSILSALVGLVAMAPANAANTQLPPEAEAVRKYILEKEYQELFQDTHYRVRISNLVVADVDNDGRKDVTVQFMPHYRQSATIAFFRITEPMEVTRVIEGLAPGPLQPISGDYLDSHAFGSGVDFSIDDKQDSAAAADSVVKSALKEFGGLVAYANFFHADGRAGNGSYIDLTHISNVPGANNCEAFEYATIREIAVGHLKGHDQNYLAAWVGDEIYVYLIRAVRDNGLLDKKFWVRKAPAGFKGFMPGKGLAFVTASGDEETLGLDSE